VTVRKVKGFEYRCDAPMYDAAQIMEDPHDITGLRGVVYEYNFSREVWLSLPMRALSENGLQQNVVGLRGPFGTEFRVGTTPR